MKDRWREQLLELLDCHRRCLAEPGTVALEFSPDRSTCRILLGPATAPEIATLAAEQTALADRHGYRLEGSEFAELAGARTKSAHRGRGYFRALVRHRVAEASARGHTHVLVDALPTSEPTLRRLGFTVLTSARPYVYQPGRARP